MNRQQTFARVYQTNAWHGDETRAGPGSTMTATARLQVELPKLLERLGVTSLLDAGCNEAHWIPEVPGYVGVDIVPQALRIAQRRHPGLRFEVADICVDHLPRCDAVLCRDALQHLSYADGLAALANFRSTRARWLITSSHRGETNVDIATGQWYPIDVQAPPFSLGEPSWEISDGTWGDSVAWPQKILGLWTL